MSIDKLLDLHAQNFRIEFDCGCFDTRWNSYRCDAHRKFCGSQECEKRGIND